jgi:hypothetical protein
VALCAALFCGCGKGEAKPKAQGPQARATLSKQGLVGVWKAIGKAAEQPTENARLRFSPDGKMNGVTAQNNIQGTYAVQGNELVIKPTHVKGHPVTAGDAKELRGRLLADGKLEIDTTLWVKEPSEPAPDGSKRP